MASSSKYAMASVLLFVFSAIVGLSSAAVYTVGDAKGWTIMNPPNYTDWASKKTFHVGDFLLFVYNKQFHNVIEVKKPDYDACTEKSPIATYTTGNDSIAIKTAGSHYYLCGIPGHCSLGQKVEITVAAAKSVAPGSSAAPSPSTGSGSGSAPAPEGPVTPPESGGSAAGVPAPAPKASNAPVDRKGLGLVVCSLVLAAVVAGLLVSV